MTSFRQAPFSQPHIEKERDLQNWFFHVADKGPRGFSVDT